MCAGHSTLVQGGHGRVQRASVLTTEAAAARSEVLKPGRWGAGCFLPEGMEAADRA